MTRAFLVVLRLIPAVQAAFIDAIREKQREQGNGLVVPSRTATDEGLGASGTRSGPFARMNEDLDLDDHDRLTEEIDERIQEVVATWGAESAWEDIVTQIDA